MICQTETHHIVQHHQTWYHRVIDHCWDINSSLSVKVCSCWTPATHWSLERLLSLVSWSLLSQHQQLSQHWSCTSTNTLWSNRNKNNNNINLAHLITSTICKHWTQNTFNNCWSPASSNTGASATILSGPGVDLSTTSTQISQMIREVIANNRQVAGVERFKRNGNGRW